MPKLEGMTKWRGGSWPSVFVIGVLGFFRNSSFVLRHLWPAAPKGADCVV